MVAKSKKESKISQNRGQWFSSPGSILYRLK